MDAIKTLRELVSQREYELETIKNALAILEGGSGGRVVKTKAKTKAKVSRRPAIAQAQEGTAKHEVVTYLKANPGETFTRASLSDKFPHIPAGTVGSIVTELKEKKQIFHVDYDTTSGPKPRELYRLKK